MQTKGFNSKTNKSKQSFLTANKLKIFTLSKYDSSPLFHFIKNKYYVV